ncbi:uncharacterized protein LOC123705174 [Colias croceus]|uniref:uncharacterized protein LOC123705174 n=1 Tax=Colias crocea TaxID=72248 RepID=UPI001E27E3B7|nr:uncharacterized protein LOC123705174 [Colias croceus]
MDKFKQKLKKDKTAQNNTQDKKEMLVADVKCIRENLKIREILRNVKMNRSMRLKAPPGSKVMNNKDFTDNEDFFEENLKEEDDKEQEPPCATNPDVIITHTDFSDDNINGSTEDIEKSDIESEQIEENSDSDKNIPEAISASIEDNDINKLESYEPIRRSDSVIPDNRSIQQLLNDMPTNKIRDRKLSLDQSTLNRREGFTQSELDLHSLGKSPLERKSSFFRKKMDSFLRNTTDLFKRQSLTGKCQPVQRRGSMSVSMQSLNENCSSSNGDYQDESVQQEMRPSSSTASLQSSSTITRSASSLSICQNSRLMDQPSEPSLSGSQPAFTSESLGDFSSNSVHSLNEAYLQEAMLKSRAISMSSGLDSSNSRLRRKASRSNRVTWVASEGLTNYFRRIIQDEKSKEIQSCHSYQDFSCIPENESYGQRTDSKGRRLSYQRAVSGEDPVLPTRYQDTSLRRRHLILENNEANYELQNLLAEFSKNGVPSLQGFVAATIPDEALSYLMWSEKSGCLESIFDWKTLPETEQAKQAVIRELVSTEADYIQHLIVIVEIFIAAAHALQDNGKMLEVDTERLFSNIPDLLNANLTFWNLTFYPMVKEAVENNEPYKSELMANGFCRFHEVFQPYEKYMNEQAKMMDYFRSIQADPEFSTYLTWCYTHKSCNRLQLSDLLVKPMQRLTKYSLILSRVAVYTGGTDETGSLKAMESFVKCYVTDLNRSMRQREELEQLDELTCTIEPYELEFKDEEMEKLFKCNSALNLRHPMAHCALSHYRSVILDSEFRFKDHIGKEVEVRVILLTDLMMICKKQSKGNVLPYKMIRPKIFLARLIHAQRLIKNVNQLYGHLFLLVDECGSSMGCFSLTESSKDPTPAQSLKTLESKIKEAKMSYEMSIWAARNPNRDLSEMDLDTSTDTSMAHRIKSAEETAIENEARERVATMLHRSMGASTDNEYSQSLTDSIEGPRAGPSSSHRQFIHRSSTASSRQSRLSSFQQSLSAASRDDQQFGPSKVIYRASASLDQKYDQPITSITVNVVNECDTPVAVEQPPPETSSSLLAPSPSQPSRHTLSVHGQNNVTVLSSQPNLNQESYQLTTSVSQPGFSASERLYRSHQELLQRNRLAASQFLSPDNRGISYPPPSPTRNSLKRGLAFSYSFKNPPLSKMGNVYSQSHLDTPIYSSQHLDRGPSPSPSEKSDKKYKLLGSRSKATTSTDPEESAASSRVQTRQPSRSGDAEDSTYRSDEQVE